MFVIFRKSNHIKTLFRNQQKCLLSNEHKIIEPSGRVYIKNRKYVDSLRITVSGGSGGNGYPKYQGLGGNGGDVCLVAKSGLNLRDIKKSKSSFRAEDGQHSSKFDIIGKNGRNLEIKVPVGVTVILDEYDRVVADLDQENDKVTVAFGGRGGDKLNAYCGTRGQKLRIRLDLKLLADVGLIGYPNAGKSTLLRALSRASPKIAPYPFSTIQPNLGVIEYDPPKNVQLLNDWSKIKPKELSNHYEQDYRRITVADLPGLIDGAHRNIGLGHKFLKHILRTNLLLFVVDIDGFINKKGENYHNSWTSCGPIEVIQSLINEIDLYDPSILKNKSSILAINKLDTAEKRNHFEKFVKQLDCTNISIPSINEKQKAINNQQTYDDIDPDNETYYQSYEKGYRFDKIIGISALTKHNIDQLKGMIRELIDLDAESKQQSKSFKQLIKEQKNQTIR